MFDIAHAPFVRLTERPIGERFTRPEHASPSAGVQLLAGERPRPFGGDTLLMLSLVVAGTDIVEQARVDSAKAADQFAGTAVDAMLGAPEEAALFAAREKTAEGRAELAKAEDALRVAEGNLDSAMRASKNPAGLRKPIETAREALGDSRAWVQKLVQAENAAGAKLVARRNAVRRELVGAKLAEVEARRAALAEKAEGAIREFGAELLALDELAKALSGTK